VVEPIMFLAIGFLVASLLGLVLVPLVHNRAVRLTAKRLEATTSLSQAELQAEKDHLRAEFAVRARQLELLVEQLRAEAASQRAELGRKSDAVNRLKVELQDRDAAILALQARERELRGRLRDMEDKLTAKMGELRDAERRLAGKEAELAELVANHKIASGHLREQIAAARRVEAELREELAAARRASEASQAQEQAENALLRERISALAAEIARLVATLEQPASPIESLLAGSANAAGGGASLADRIRALQAKAARTSAMN